MTSPLTNAARALVLAQSGDDVFDDLEPEAQEAAVEHARAALAAQWQSMETAPKDGTPFLAKWKSRLGASMVFWNGANGYSSFTTGSVDRFDIPDQYGADWFTEWMPIPPTPEK
jgi:hypothetical protein